VVLAVALGGDDEDDGAGRDPGAAARAQAGGDARGASFFPVTDIYRRASRGVVFVQARAPSPPPSPFGPPPSERGAVGTGSGFVIDEEGTIVTNAHVVAGAEEIAVRFDDGGRLVPARLVGTDISSDLAVLDVDLPGDRLEPLPLADMRRVEVGEPVVAIGNPLGFEDTATTGIVSALGRQIQAPDRFTIRDVIQTDAAINPGNSGGPLLDREGRVIGVNTQIATSGGRGSIGIGFAIPAAKVRQVVPDLRDDGRVNRGYLGLAGIAVDERLARAPDLEAGAGVLVQSVEPGSAAAEAGLRPGRTETPFGVRAGGDVITRVGDRDVRTVQDLAEAGGNRRPGDRLEVTYLRDGEERTTTVTLDERPARTAQPVPPAGADEPPPFPFP